MASNAYNQPGAVQSSGTKTYNKKDVKAGKINPYNASFSDADPYEEQKKRQQADNAKRTSDLAAQVSQKKIQADQQKAQNQPSGQPKKSTASKVVSALGGIAKGAGNLAGGMVASSAEAVNKGVVKPYLTSPTAAIGSAAADASSGKGFDYKKRYKEAQNEASPVRQATKIVDKKLGTDFTSGVDYADKHTGETLLTTAAVAADIGSGGLLTPVIAPALTAYYAPKYLKGIPDAVKTIVAEPDIGKKFAMGTEMVGQGLLLAKGEKDTVAAIKKIPKTKEVNVGKTVPNDEARSFFNSPNPDITPETSSLLAKALADNKAKFVSELKAGEGITVEHIQTVPTVYGKLLNIIKGKIDKKQNLTPNEEAVVQTMANDPGQFVKTKDMVKYEPKPAEAVPPAPAAAPITPPLPPAVAAPPELPPIALPPGITHPDNIVDQPTPPPAEEPAKKGALKPLKPAVVKPKGTGMITTYSGHQGRGSAFSTPDKQFAQQFANEDANGNVVKGVVGTKKLNKADILDTRNAEDRAKLESILGQENVSKMIDSSGNGLPAHIDKGEQDALVKAAKQLGFKHIALSETDNQTKYNGSHVISYVDTSADVTKEVTQQPKVKAAAKPAKKTGTKNVNKPKTPEAQPTVHLTVEGGKQAEFPAKYYRIGRPPANQNSINHVTGKPEGGVSVFKGYEGPSGKITIDALHDQNELANGKKMYEVTGIPHQYGSDDESLLKPGSVKIVKEIDPKKVVPDNNPDYNYHGEDISLEYPTFHEPVTKPKGAVKPLKKTAAPPATAEKPHITAGRLEAAKMKEPDVLAVLDKKLKPYAEGKANFEAFANHIQEMGGTFGNFNGHFDTSTAKQGTVTVKLRDGREFKYKMADIFSRLNKPKPKGSVKPLAKKVELQKPKSSDKELVASVAGEYKNSKDFVKDTAEGYYNLEKSLKGGQLIDKTGVNDPYGSGMTRITEHTPFYSKFYKDHGKAPTLTDYVEAVQNELDTGRGNIIENAEHDIYHLLNKQLDTKAYPKTSYSGTSGSNKAAPSSEPHPLDLLHEKARKFDNVQDFYDSLRPVERDVARRHYAKRDGETELDQFKRVMESAGAKLAENKPAGEDYAMSHRPRENGVRAFDLTEEVDGERVIPQDMYTEWYGSRGTAADKESIAALKAIHNQPDATVTVYRAAPQNKLNKGDWITFSKDYAHQHAEGHDNLKVYKFSIKARDARWAMDDINEFGYFPGKASFSGTSGGGATKPTGTEEAPTAKATTRTIKTSNPVKKFIDETGKYKEVAGKLDDQLHALGGHNIADNIALNHLFKEVKKLDATPKDWTAIYHYSEDRSAPITPEQKDLYESTVQPLQESINKMRTDMGLKPFKSDEFIHRIAQSHGSTLERYLQGDAQNVTSGSVLKKTSDSMKTRTWMKLVDPKNPHVFHIVSIKSPKNKLGKALGERQVTAFTYGKKTPMGALKRKIPTPTTEFNDPHLMDQLEKIATGLGVKHVRTNMPLKRGDTAAGVHYGGTNIVKTRAASAPDVLLHEIGHFLDHKYDMQSQFLGNIKDQATKEAKEEQRTIKQELRDLADKRIGEGGSRNFSKYVRTGEEKMAVMFQAYLHAPEIFKAVAPVTYDKFDAFLRSHPETKPIANIEKSLQLGKDVIGDVRHEGEFIDKTGKKWKIINATTKEIEANSDTRYFKQPLVSTAIDYMQTRQALRASHFLDTWKESPDFLYKEHPDGTVSGIAVKSDAKTIPEGWKTTTAPQFRGYHFEPRTAEVLDDFARTAAKGDPLGAFTGMNLFLRNTIFFNPLMHVPNIMWHAVMRRGISGFSNPVRIARGTTSSVQAINELVHNGSLYQELLREGAPLMSFDRQGLNKMIGQMMEDTIQDDKAVSTLAKLAGYTSKANFIKAWYKVSSGVTWGSHDFFMLQAMIEEMKRGLTAQEAIHEVTAHIPDYRLPTRFANSRSLKTTLSNKNVTMFLPYHYGIFKSYANTIREMGGAPPRGGKQETGFIGRAKTSARGVDKLIMFGVIALLIYPELDKLAKKITGEDNAINRRPGPFTVPYAVYRMLHGKRSIQSTAMLILPTPPGTKGAIQLIRNRDDLNRQIWNPGDAFKLPAQATKDVGHFVLGTIAPAQQLQRAKKGQLSIKQFGESLVGIATPNDTKNLVSKLYSEQINLGVQSKAQQRINERKNAARDQIAEGKGDSLAKSLVSDGIIKKKKLDDFKSTANWTSTQRTFDNLTPANKLLVLQDTPSKNWPQLVPDLEKMKKDLAKTAKNKNTSTTNRDAANRIEKMLNGDG
jgi:hypothetical protein